MQRFKANDAVFVLPKYAHLYPGNSAVVIGVTADRFRPMFNEYFLEFPNRSTGKLFEFQIIEDVADYETLIALVAFDSRQQTATTETRGPTSGQQIILRTGRFDMDMKIRMANSRASIVGQVLETETKNLLKNLDVRLMREAVPVTSTKSDSLGVFKFSEVLRGSLNILVVIPQYSSRILGTFSI
jgi:hypothetical protein